jgi:DNA-binding winged helix-turn-helix (wHTH) protein/dipeptidyl aminopeptidase/acylaminoacyl peptidase
MMVHKPGKRLVRFGLFELDLEAGELRKQGVKLQLQPKPLQMLQILLERPGEVVSRQELCRRLWGDETFVDFESGLNTAANRLRLKLGDSAESPRYIETVARNGYRFVAPVASVDWALPETEPERIAEQPQPVPKRPPFPVAVLALTAVLAILCAAYFIFRPSPAARAHFRQLTFRAGQVSGARFTPDGHAVLYSAQWNGEPRQLYLTSAVAPESRLLGFPDMSLAAVSSLGELALLNGGGTMNIGGGRLSRVPMNGGSPLLLDQGIVAAEWSRDGRALALVRASKGASQLEFPPGKVLYHTSGWLSGIRFSPAGDEIAFIEHPLRHDDSGDLKLLSLRAGVKTLSPDWVSITGAAWHPKRGEIWFSAARGGEPRSIWAATRSGKIRPVAQAPGSLTLRDIAPDGRVLVARESRRLEMAGRIGPSPAEKDFSWLDWSRVQDLSRDHHLILFDESGEAAGAHSLVYLQNTADRSIVRLGEGVAMALSPDGKFTLTASENRRHLRLTPVTGGASRELADTGLKYQWAKFFPDGRKLLVLASQPQKGLRLYVEQVDTGAVVPISPETMVRNAAISADGSRVAVLAPDNRLILYRTDNGPPEVVPSDEPLAPLRWTANGDSIYVQHLRGSGDLPARISIVRVSSGELKPWKEITPADRLGVTSVTGVAIGSDEQSYVYSFRRQSSELYVVENW